MANLSDLDVHKLTAGPGQVFLVEYPGHLSVKQREEMVALVRENWEQSWLEAGVSPPPPLLLSVGGVKFSVLEQS